jgi:hypothetical protein
MHPKTIVSQEPARATAFVQNAAGRALTRALEAAGEPQVESVRVKIHAATSIDRHLEVFVAKDALPAFVASLATDPTVYRFVVGSPSDRLCGSGSGW